MSPMALGCPPDSTQRSWPKGSAPIRHLAVRDNGDFMCRRPGSAGQWAAGSSRCTLMRRTRPREVQHFGSIDGGTGIRFHNRALYATRRRASTASRSTATRLWPGSGSSSKERRRRLRGSIGRTGRSRSTRAHMCSSPIEASANFCAEPPRSRTRLRSASSLAPTLARAPASGASAPTDRPEILRAARLGRQASAT